MSGVHAKAVVTADDGTSEVGSDEWNATHNDLIPTGGGQLETDHMAVTARQVAAGTGRLTLQEPLLYMKGAYGLGTVDLLPDTYVLQYKRATLAGDARVSIYGSAEMFLFDLAPVGRLVLAGRGGTP